MSMSINGKFELDEITPEDIYQMAQNSNINGRLILKEYHRIKGLLLPTAEKVLKESVFSEKFKNAFLLHLSEMHSQLPF